MTPHELVKQLYSAVNCFDVEAYLSLFHSEALRHEFPGTPGGGTFRGREEFRANFEKGRSSWAEGTCTPERVTVLGDHVIVDAHVRVRLKDRTDWIDGRVADVFLVRDGKILEFHSFSDEVQAKSWVSKSRSSIDSQ